MCGGNGLWGRTWLLPVAGLLPSPLGFAPDGLRTPLAPRVYPLLQSPHINPQVARVVIAAEGWLALNDPFQAWEEFNALASGSGGRLVVLALRARIYLALDWPEQAASVASGLCAR